MQERKAEAMPKQSRSHLSAVTKATTKDPLLTQPEKLESGQLPQSRDRLYVQPAWLAFLSIMPNQSEQEKAEATLAAIAELSAQTAIVQKVAEVAVAALRRGNAAMFFRAVELCGPSLLWEPVVRTELEWRWYAISGAPVEDVKVIRAFFQELGHKLSVGAKMGPPQRTTKEEKEGQRYARVKKFRTKGKVTEALMREEIEEKSEGVARQITGMAEWKAKRVAQDRIEENTIQKNLASPDPHRRNAAQKWSNRRKRERYRPD